MSFGNLFQILMALRMNDLGISVNVKNQLQIYTVYDGYII